MDVIAPATPATGGRQATHRGVGDRRVGEAEPDADEQVGRQEQEHARVLAEPDQAESAHRDETAYQDKRQPRSGTTDQAAGQGAQTVAPTAMGKVATPAASGVHPRACCR